MNMAKEYIKNDTTVILEPEKSILFGNSSINPSQVFNINDQSWISPDGTDFKNIKHVVNACPSGVLGYQSNRNIEKEPP